MVDVLTKIPARDFDIEINVGYGTTGGDDWTHIGGLLTLTPSPKSTQADTADRDSAGVASHMVMERGRELTLEGQHLEDAATGGRDPGQAAVEALGEQVGLQSLGQFRITSPGGNVDTFLASAEVTPAGGGKNDPATWSAKLTVSGAVVHT